MIQITIDRCTSPGNMLNKTAIKERKHSGSSKCPSLPHCSFIPIRLAIPRACNLVHVIELDFRNRENEPKSSIGQ